MLIRPRFVRSRSRMDRCQSAFRKARGKHDQAKPHLVSNALRLLRVARGLITASVHMNQQEDDIVGDLFDCNLL